MNKKQTKYLTWFFILILGIAIVYGINDNNINPPPPNELTWLHVDGKWIKDEEGNTMALRGVATQWNRYTYDYSVNGAMVNKWRGTLKWMNENGYTSSRVRFRFDDSQFTPERLDLVVDLFEQYGIYMVLSCNYGYDLKDYYADGSWITNWVALAERYKNKDVIAAFELANEGFWYDSNDPSSCRRAFKECIAAIRQVDSKHILVVYEPVRNWRTAELCFQGVSWYQDNVLWRLDDLPQDNNIAFKFGYHWTVIRQQTAGSTSYEYYKDKLNIAEAYGADYVDCLVKWRDYFNMPVLNYEFGDYDDNPTHANYAGWKEIIRLCNEQCIPWNYHWLEHWVNHHSATWKTDVPAFAGSYATPYFGTPQKFEPKPFNLLDKAVSFSNPWGVYGPGLFWMTDSNYYITLEGPCSVRERVFDGYPDQRTLTNMIADNIITVKAGETKTIQGVDGEPHLITPYKVR